MLRTDSPRQRNFGLRSGFRDQEGPWDQYALQQNVFNIPKVLQNGAHGLSSDTKELCVAYWLSQSKKLRAAYLLSETKELCAAYWSPAQEGP